MDLQCISQDSLEKQNQWDVCIFMCVCVCVCVCVCCLRLENVSFFLTQRSGTAVNPE